MSDLLLTMLADIVTWVDADLDDKVSERYIEEPLGQDWARIAKIGEEFGEVVDAFIGTTGQNPRKGHYGDIDDVLTELMDVALTAIYAAQHFTKDASETLTLLLARAKYQQARRQSQIQEEEGPPPGVEPGACDDPSCNVLHDDPSNPIHPFL